MEWLIKEIQVSDWSVGVDYVNCFEKYLNSSRKVLNLTGQDLGEKPTGAETGEG